MAPLKVSITWPEAQKLPKYPWLRGHGSIEGVLMQAGAGAQLGVSMAERSWLH